MVRRFARALFRLGVACGVVAIAAPLGPAPVAAGKAAPARTVHVQYLLKVQPPSPERMRANSAPVSPVMLASAKAEPPRAPAPAPVASPELLPALPTPPVATANVALPAEDPPAHPSTGAAAPPMVVFPTQELVLQLGQSRVLDFRGLRHVAIADPKVADVVPVSGSDLVVTAVAPGETTLYTWDSSGRRTYRVVVPGPPTPDMSSMVMQLAQSIADPDIKVTPLGNTLLLEGTVDNPAASARAEAMAKALHPTVQNLIQVRQVPRAEPSRAELAVRMINDALEGSGVTARPLSDTMVLVDGTVTAPEAERVRRVVMAVAKNVDVADGLRVAAAGAKQVLIRARVVDINRSKLKDLGVQWGQVNSEGQDGNVKFTISDQPFVFGIIRGDFDKLLPFGGRLNALIQENAARILSEPNIVVLEGSAGTILVGGEFPVPVVQNQAGGLGAVTVEFKEFGVRLRVEPLTITGDDITLKVTPEVSLLDFANAVTVSGFTLPALRTRREETTVRITSGRTLAIGGLIENNYSRVVSRIPLISKIPVLGELFKSKGWQRNENELVILITPSVVPPEGPGGVNPLDSQAPNLRIEEPNVPPEILPKP